MVLVHQRQQEEHQAALRHGEGQAHQRQLVLDFPQRETEVAEAKVPGAISVEEEEEKRISVVEEEEKNICCGGGGEGISVVEEDEK